MKDKGNPLRHFGAYAFTWGKERPTADSLLRIARHAEELGFDSVQVPWHFTLPEGWMFPEFGNRYLLDPLVVLPLLVEGTKSIKVGVNAAILTTLHPFFWAQYFSSLDVISRGRVMACFAIGWWKEDFQVGMARAADRGRRMDEALDVVTRLWAGEPVENEGGFWDARGLRLEPRPAHHIPLWVGGAHASVERAARWADVLMPMTPTTAELHELRALLDAASAPHARKVGLATLNYAVTSKDRAWIRDHVMPRLRSCLHFEDAGGIQGDEFGGRVMSGDPEEAAAVASGLLAAGSENIILDFQFHGLEGEEYGMRQMEQFAKNVAPLIEAPRD